MRDRAIDGLRTLACREVWRTSQHGGLILGLVTEAMTDENPVVRMSAARAFHVINSNVPAPERVRALGELLHSETNSHVYNVYISLLGSEAHESPREVDDALRKLAIQPDSISNPALNYKDTRDLSTKILTFLAVRYQTPFATEVAETWATNAPLADEALLATKNIRGYLAPDSDPVVQARAFDLVTKAANSCLKHWNALLERQTSQVETSASEQEQLKHSLSVLKKIASQLYFASGAFGEKKGNETTRTASDAGLERFADLATPVLVTCARSKAAGIVHHVVETLVFFATLDEKRALISIMEAVGADGNYAYDPISGNAVIPYLRRLLAEQRHLVLFDEEGVIAFRKLLTAFASAGNESALELAFSFSDVFR